MSIFEMNKSKCLIIMFLLLNLKENQNLELKERFSIHIVSTICAFLNTTGGKILIGYSARERRIVGHYKDGIHEIYQTMSMIYPNPNDYIEIQQKEDGGIPYYEVNVQRSQSLHYVEGYQGCNPTYYVRKKELNIKLSREKAQYYRNAVVSELPFIKNYEPSESALRKTFQGLLYKNNNTFEQIGNLPNGNQLYKYMSLDTALTCLGDKNKAGSLRFVEPTKWVDRYEGLYYNAKYYNKSGSLNGSIPDPILFANCFSTKQDNEAAWKLYTYGKTGLGSICVEFKINRFKLRSELIKPEIQGYSLYVGKVEYMAPSRIESLCKPKLVINGHREENPDYNKYFSGYNLYNYLNLLLLKRKAFSHEEEIRFFIDPKMTGKKSYVNKKNVFVEKNKPIDVPIDWISLIEEVRIGKCGDLEYSLLRDKIFDLIENSSAIIDKEQVKQQLTPIRYDVYECPQKLKINIP